MPVIPETLYTYRGDCPRVVGPTVLAAYPVAALESPYGPLPPVYRLYRVTYPRDKADEWQTSVSPCPLRRARSADRS